VKWSSSAAAPQGLSAAIEAARSRRFKVLVCDENKRPGGQLFKQIHKFFGSKAHNAGMRGIDIAKRLLKETRGQRRRGVAEQPGYTACLKNTAGGGAARRRHRSGAGRAHTDQHRRR
jgi:hypothetical protein